MKLINVLLLLGALVAPTSAGPTWQALLNNPFWVNNSQVSPRTAYGHTGFSSFVVGPSWNWQYENMGFSVYYDKAPPSGSAGYLLMEMNCFQIVKNQPPDFQNTVTYDVPIYDGPLLQHHLARMYNSNEGNVYLFYTPISNPNQVWMTKMNHDFLGPPEAGCNGFSGYDTWLESHSVIYTAPSGFDIASVSAVAYNDNKYVAISLVSHGEPGPVVLLKSYDMVSFTSMGLNITDANGNSITTFETFSLFTAASPVTSGEEAVYLYYITSSSSQAFLRYANPANLSIGRFQDVADLFPFNSNDLLLVEQLGTAAAVSPDGKTIFLLRHGRDYCNNQGSNMMVQKTFFPVTYQVYADEPVMVKDPNGTIRPVDSAIMPALTTDRCANGGEVHPGRQVNLMWADRSSLQMMQGFANPW